MNDHHIEESRYWIEKVVVGLNLCPFAQLPLSTGRDRFSVSQATSPENLFLDMAHELNLLTKDQSVETTLLIHPMVLTDFYDFNDFLSVADALLVEMNLDGIFQIASFHPRYQFAGTQPDDVENYTNRSPYPMLHILRESSLDQVIDSHPDVENIPLRNREKMNAMGIKALKSLLGNKDR